MKAEISNFPPPKVRAEDVVGKVVTVYHSPWPNEELDRAMRCFECGQVLGKRCARDGCGRQVINVADLIDDLLEEGF